MIPQRKQKKHREAESILVSFHLLVPPPYAFFPFPTSFLALPSMLFSSFLPVSKSRKWLKPESESKGCTKIRRKRILNRNSLKKTHSAVNNKYNTNISINFLGVNTSLYNFLCIYFSPQLQSPFSTRIVISINIDKFFRTTCENRCLIHAQRNTLLLRWLLKWNTIMSLLSRAFFPRSV